MPLMSSVLRPVHSMAISVVFTSIESFAPFWSDRSAIVPVIGFSNVAVAWAIRISFNDL